MHIVKRGVDPKEKPFKLTCSTCKTVVELLSGELTESQPDWPQLPTNRYCVCPVCQSNIYDSKENREKSKDYLD